MVPLPTYFGMRRSSCKAPNEYNSFIVDLYIDIYLISIWYYMNNKTDMIVIKCNNCNKTASY